MKFNASDVTCPQCLHLGLFTVQRQTGLSTIFNDFFFFMQKHMPELEERASYIKTKIKTIFQHDDSNEKPENEQLPPTPTLEPDETAPLLNVEDQVVSAASNLGEDKVDEPSIVSTNT